MCLSLTFVLCVLRNWHFGIWSFGWRRFVRKVFGISRISHYRKNAKVSIVHEAISVRFPKCTLPVNADSYSRIATLASSEFRILRNGMKKKNWGPAKSVSIFWPCQWIFQGSRPADSDSHVLFCAWLKWIFTLRLSTHCLSFKLAMESVRLKQFMVFWLWYFSLWWRSALVYRWNSNLVAL